MQRLNPVTGEESTLLISRNLRNYGTENREEEKKLEPAESTIEHLRAVWNIPEAEKNELIALALQNARVRNSEHIESQLSTIRTIAGKYRYLLGQEYINIENLARRLPTALQINFNHIEQQLLSHHFSKLELCLQNPYTRVAKRGCFWMSCCALMTAYFSATGGAEIGLIGKPAYDAILGAGMGLTIASATTFRNFVEDKWKAENLYFEYLQSLQADIMTDILKLKYAEVYLRSLAADPEGELQELCNAQLEHLRTVIEFAQKSFSKPEQPPCQVMRDGPEVKVPRMTME